MSTTSATVTGKSQLTVSDLGHVAERETAIGRHGAAGGGDAAEQRAQQRRLARARRSDDPAEVAGPDRSASRPRAPVCRRRYAHVTADRASSTSGSLIAGTPPGPARRRPSKRPQRARVPAEARHHRDEVEAHEPEPGVVGGHPVAPGRSSSRSSSTYRTSVSLPICGQHRAGEDLRPEDGRHPLGPHLVDESGDLLRRRVLEVRDLDRADDLPAVVLPEVRVRVVVGQQLAVARRAATAVASVIARSSSSTWRRTRRSWPRSAPRCAGSRR